MPNPDTSPIPLASAVRDNCPNCNGHMAILRVIGGKSGSEYWTMRCTRCGGIHLDILQPSSAACTEPLPIA